MEFALSTKTPGPNGRLPGVSRKEFDTMVQDALLRMLNISHTHQTLVGDEFVRGVSGGERKRVSIAEMMATRARVQCWDNSTRGLDASTALDFAKSLRIMTDVLGQTTFVSLYVREHRMSAFFNHFLQVPSRREYLRVVRQGPCIGQGSSGILWTYLGSACVLREPGLSIPSPPKHARLSDGVHGPQ